MKAIIPYRRYLRAGLVLLEVMAIVACVVAGMTGIAFWRLSRGPVDVGFARPFIEDSFSDKEKGKSLTVERLKLYWPRINQPLRLYMGGVSVLENGAPIMEMRSLSVSLSGPYLFIGRIVPVSIVFREPALYLLRTADDKISLRFQEESDIAKEQAAAAAAPAVSPDTPVIEVPSAEIPAPVAVVPVPEVQPKVDEDSKVIIDEIVRALTTDDSQKSSRIAPLRNLRSVQVENARALVEDHVSGTTWRMSDLELSFLRDDDEILIEATADTPAEDGSSSGIELSAVYRLNSGMIANLTLTNFDPSVVTGKVSGLQGIMISGVRISGQANLATDKDLKPLMASLDFSASSGTFNYDNMYAEPVAIEEMRIKGKYDNAAEIMDLSDFLIRAHGIEIHASGKGSVTDDSVSMPLSVKIPDVSQALLKEIWPSSLKGSQAEDWIVRRMSGGTVSNAAFNMNLAAAKGEQGWSADVNGVKASFEITGMDVDYNAPLHKAEKVSGKGTFDDHVLDVQITQGKIMDIDVTGGRVRIDHIGHDDQISNADITLRVKGPLGSLFRYIESEPIAIKGQEIGIDATNVQGLADLEANITFPAVHDLPKDDVVVKVSGTVDQILLPDVVEKLDLSGGPYQLNVADGMVSMKGSGALEGRPVTLDFSQFISLAGKPYSSKIKASLAADNDLRAAIGVGLPEWIDGAPRVDVIYTSFKDNKSDVEIIADLSTAKFMVAPFDYTKPAGVRANLTCKAILKDKKLQEIKDLVVAGQGVRLDSSRFTFTNPGSEPVLQTGNIPRLQLGDTNAKIALSRIAGNILKVDLSGASLDAQPFLKRKDQQQTKADNTGVQATVTVDSMKTYPGNPLISKARAYLEIDQSGRARRIEFDATAGAGPLSVRLMPDAQGINTLSITADDAGATLRAFDVFKEMRGGKMFATGRSPDAASRFTINGKAEITNFRVVGAPALARLVSLLSLSGMSEVLSGEGMSFARMRTDFTWAIRKPGDIYTLKDGGTSGSSLGISFGGTVNKETNKIDMRGEIVPASEVNGFLGSIPIIGDILTGGGGALFAATYSITGPLDKQEVSVNPLSVLTPGIIRKMLFE